LLREMDAFRRPERFEKLLLVCTADHAGRGGELPPYTTAERWRDLLAAANTIDAGAIAAACATPGEIPGAIERARAAAIAAIANRRATPDSA